MEDALFNKKKCNILISQPRKIAAVMNSTRVAAEIKCQLGTFVGFQHSLHRCADLGGEKTRLLFATTGVILNKLIIAKSMDMFTHIVLGKSIQLRTLLFLTFHIFR